MLSHTTREFRELLSEAPEAVRAKAEAAYRLWAANPAHPSLRFKKVGRFWSARVGAHYRALAVEATDGVVWFWIGTHADYDRLLG